MFTYCHRTYPYISAQSITYSSSLYFLIFFIFRPEAGFVSGGFWFKSIFGLC